MNAGAFITNCTGCTKPATDRNANSAASTVRSDAVSAAVPPRERSCSISYEQVEHCVYRLFRPTTPRPNVLTYTSSGNTVGLT